MIGASVTLAFAPFNYWWIAFIAFPAWLYFVINSNLSSFKLSFAFGLGYFGIGLSWVHVSIADFGGLPLVGSIALMSLLAVYLSLFPASCIAILKRFINTASWPIFLPLSWLLMEWLRARLLTGFPWLSIGYSQLNGPFNGLFPIIGEIGVSAIFICICASLAVALTSTQQHLAKRFIWPGMLTICFALSAYLLNHIEWTSRTGDTHKITMIQGNIPQLLRWAPEQDEPTMTKYLSMSEAHWDSDIIIWPEAAIPKLEPIATDFLYMLDQLSTENETALVTGIVNYQFETEHVYNNLIALGFDTKSSNDKPYRYMHSNRFAKHHLLPVGEFVPFESWLRNLAPIFDLPMSSFTRGDYKQQNLQTKGLHLAPAICFEIAFPSQISANLYQHTDAIITVSNDAWFGNSHGPHQHLQIAQIRAKEFGLPVLRATNNGITAFIDEFGEIEAVAAQFEDAVLTHQLAIVQGETPYRKYGDWPIYLFFLLLSLVSFSQKRVKIAS